MKAIVQRVTGKTSLESKLESRSESGSFEGPGLVVLLGWQQKDLEASPETMESNEQWLFDHIVGLRIFPDAASKMNENLAAHLEREKITGGGILWVPQFTLAGELKSGYRPSFTAAMDPQQAKIRFARWRQRCEALDVRYKQLFGIFSADMLLSFSNWGPVTIPLEI
jgi:D-tyrosyl-tRNA(Tyr) deacylase